MWCWLLAVGLCMAPISRDGRLMLDLIDEVDCFDDITVIQSWMDGWMDGSRLLYG